jgi:hypothetical protein
MIHCLCQAFHAVFHVRVQRRTVCVALRQCGSENMTLKRTEKTGPRQGPFLVVLGGAGPVPGARPAQFVARQNTKDENLASIDAGEVLLPRRARNGIIGRRAQGPQGLILLEEPPIETKRTPPPFLSGFLFPATRPMFQKRKVTRKKLHSDRLNFPGVWLTTEIGDLEPCLP